MKKETIKEVIILVIFGFIAILTVITAVDNYNTNKRLDSLQLKYKIQSEQLDKLVGENTREDLDMTLNGLIELTNSLDVEFKENNEKLLLLADYIDRNSEAIKHVAEVMDSNTELYNKQFKELYRWLSY